MNKGMPAPCSFYAPCTSHVHSMYAPAFTYVLCSFYVRCTFRRVREAVYVTNGALSDISK